MIRYENIIVFQKILEAGSFRKAAQAMNLSQPNLSYMIRRLEDRLDARLFERGVRGVHLTEAGKIFATRAAEMSALWQDISTDLLNDVKEARWRLSLGAHPEVAAYTFPLFLGNLLLEHPQLRVQIKHGLSREINQMLIDSEIDLGIVINPIPQPDLVIRDMAEDYVTIWIASPCLNPDLLIYDPSLAQTQWILRHLPHTQFKRHIECSNLSVIRSLIAAGVGAGVLPARVAVGLQEYSSDAPRFKDRIAMVYKQRLKEKPAARDVIETIFKATSSHRPK